MLLYRRRIHLIAPLTVVLLVALTGCATSGDDAEPDRQQTVEQQPDQSDEAPESMEREEREQLNEEVTTALSEAELFDAADGEDPPTVATKKWRATDEQPELAADVHTLSVKMETFLVNETDADVVSLRDREELQDEIDSIHRAEVIPPDAPESGKMVDPRYLVVGYLERKPSDESHRSVFQLEVSVADLKNNETVFETTETVESMAQ